MGWIRGNPRGLLLAFFTLAVFLTGSIFSTWDWSAAQRDIAAAFTMAALISALAFALTVLLRILWVAHQSAGPNNGGYAPDRRRGAP